MNPPDADHPAGGPGAVHRIVVNGEPRPVRPGTTLAAVVTSLTGATAGIAVAVNGTVVPRGRWVTEPVNAGDAVEIVTAVQGG